MEKVSIEENGKVLIKQGDNLYTCVVREIDDDAFYVEKPSRKENGLMLEVLDIVSADYYTEFGTYYELQLKVLGKTIENGVLLYKFSKPIKSKKIQRRNFVRVMITEYTVCKSEVDYNWEKAILLDLSGGGLKLKVNKKLLIGEKVKVKLQYKEEIFTLEAKVLRYIRVENNGYIYGLEFNDIDERKRDKIVAKVFEVMRRQREIM